jgi:hypothetical protein
MYLVYKTSHVNGKFYIGRHTTQNINDGYLGSGNWVKSIKDKSVLSREIIAEASSIEELCRLEEYYIGIHFENPDCMNYKKGSDGNTSEDAKNIARKLVAEGKHHFLGGEISRRSNQQRIKNGTHNWVGGDFQRKQQKERVENGTHHFIGGEIARIAANKRVQDGLHHFIGGVISREITHRRIKAGTHNFQGDNNPSRKKVKDGTHHFQQPWECPYCGKTGKGIGLYKRWHGENCKKFC